MLTRFASALDAGAIYGPFPNGSHSWEIRGARVIPVVTSIWPWLGPVKRGQFRTALAAFNNALTTQRAKSLTFVEPSGATSMDRFGLAWAAGLFDGDGSTCNRTRHLKDGVTSCGIKASVSQSGPEGVPEVLERFRAVVGFGHIYGPGRWRNSTEPGFDWTAQAYRDVRQLRRLLGPLVGPVKLAQMDEAIARFERSPHRRMSAFRSEGGLTAPGCA